MAFLFEKIKNFITDKSLNVIKPEPVQPAVTEPEPAQSVAPESVQPEGPRKINQDGVALIHSFESLELSAYPDPGSALGRACTARNLLMRGYRRVSGWESLSGAPWTIGWGHTGKMPDGSPVAAGKSVTREQADALFAADLEAFEIGVAGLVKSPISDNQFAALVSFAYNVGLGGLSGSTLLRKLNDGDYSGAAACFEDWSKVKDKKTGKITVLPGLARRRKAERDLFLKE